MRCPTPLWLPLLAALGCTGQLGELEPLRPDGDGELDVLTPPPDPVAEPGDVPLRRLNAEETAQTIEDVFRVTLDEDHAPPVDTVAGLYDRDVRHQEVDASMARSYLDMAVFVAREADVAALSGGCASEDCVEPFVRELLLRAFRRPADAEEIALYMERYEAGRERGSVEEGLREVIGHVAAAPDLLYVVELAEGEPDDDGRVRLGGEEIVTRLAYLLWRRPPDDALLARAAAGELDDDAGVRAVVDQMLEDPRSAAGVQAFHGQWLALENARVADLRDGADAYGGDLGPRLEASMRQWVERVFSADGSIEELLAGDGLYADADVAALAGVDAPAGGFAPDRRAGVLLHPGFLTTHAHNDETSPILRGAFLLQRVACADLESPDFDVSGFEANDSLPTTRERVEDLTSASVCAGCHRSINPIGFALEGYDWLGRPRAEDNGHPVHTADAFGGEWLEGRFEGADDMLDTLVGSELVSDCYLRQWFRFAYARPETGGEALELAALNQSWRDAGGGVLAALRVIVTAPSFVTRPEETP